MLVRRDLKYQMAAWKHLKQLELFWFFFSRMRVKLQQHVIAFS